MMARELDKTDMRRVICEAGRCAVLKGREIWGGPNDNDMREEFLTALMAVELHNVLGEPVRTELKYHAIYRVLAESSSGERIKGERADVVIGKMEGDKFVSTKIIEVKKFAENASVANIVADLDKSRSINSAVHVDIYAGVLVCQISTAALDERKKMLENALNSEIVYSDEECSKSKQWRWSFACLQRPSNVAVI